MKKSIFLLSTFALIGFSSIAQDKRPQPMTAPAAAPAPQTATPAQNPDLSIKFKEEEHSFGNIPEGPSASYDFEFKNIGKVPIIFSDVHGSCGCTVPTWPKEPILPGKTGKIAVTYSTQGRVGQINKTVTVTSNVGTKILKISGNVDKADTPAAPAAPAQDAHQH